MVGAVTVPRLGVGPGSALTALGVELPDPELEASVQTTLVAVEHELRASIESADPFITEAASHLVDAGGKRFRPLLVSLGAHFGEPSAPEVVSAAVVVELTHLATLYHDDVMDEAPVRRGAPSANSRWTNHVAILVGDYLFARAADIAASLGPAAVHIQARTFSRLVHGQIAETVGPRADDPIDHYLRVISAKTGSLIETCARFGGMFGGAPDTVTGAIAEYGQPSSSPTTCSTSRPSRPSRARLPVPTCAKAYRPCPCCTRWPRTSPMRHRYGYARSCRPARSATM
jgi:heptaprenyl diphosphate synthase